MDSGEHRIRRHHAAALGICVLVAFALTHCSSNGPGGTTQNDASVTDGTADTAVVDASPADADVTDGNVTPDADTVDAAPPEPCSELVYEQQGLILTVVDGASHWSVSPLNQGEGFTCMRVEFDLHTHDCVQQILDMNGCPTFYCIAGISAVRKMGGALLRHWRAQQGCIPGPHRMQIDCFWGSDHGQAPWQYAQTYRVTIEVIPFTSTFTMSQGGVPVGSVSVVITGATVADTVNPTVNFGIPQSSQSAYFPMYGATYSNLQVWATRATPP
jgi:hypothetical protein